jgi:hypothetical protein
VPDCDQIATRELTECCPIPAAALAPGERPIAPRICRHSQHEEVLCPEDRAWLAWARATVLQEPVKVAVLQHMAAMFAAERAARRRRKKSLFVASATNIACKHFGLVSHDTIVPVERSPRLVALPPGAKRDLPPRVPGGGGTMRAQWANWKKLSPVFGSKDLIWTDALSRVVVCWRPSSRISPGPVPRIDKLWSRY